MMHRLSDSASVRVGHGIPAASRHSKTFVSPRILPSSLAGGRPNTRASPARVFGTGFAKAIAGMTIMDLLGRPAMLWLQASRRLKSCGSAGYRREC